jgi:uncharacterized protein YdeI (BOF family)
MRSVILLILSKNEFLAKLLTISPYFAILKPLLSLFMPENTPKDPELLKEDIIRLNHLETFREAKIEAFPAQSARTHTLKEAFGAGEGAKVTVTGRLVAFRDMGKLAFGHLQDDSGKLQIAISEKELGKDTYKFFVKNFDLGDFVQIEGEIFTTHKGEISVLVKKYTLLAKALLPMPEKWHGLQNIEMRYRQRYLDLMSNEESMRIAKLRSVLVKELRNFFDAKGFYEVETPILQPLYGGANAKPFVTHHNALDIAGSTTGDFSVNTNQLFVDTSTGNVGVGTASPSNKLDVAGNIGGTGNIFLGANTPTASDLHSTWNQLRIGLTGNIIGENGAGGIDGISLTNNAYIKTSSGSFAYLTTAAANRIHMNAGTTKFQYAASGTAGAALTFTDAMTIDSTGNVGIGTTTPNNKLDVNGILGVVNGTGRYVTLAQSGTEARFVTNDKYWFDTDGIVRASINDGGLSVGSTYYTTNAPSSGAIIQGNVGIGTTSPSTFKLEVAGNIGPSATNAYNLGASGKNFGCLYYDSGTLGTCASDARLKENVQDLSFGDNVLQKLLNLTARTYTYTTDDTHSEYHGLVAQEVQQAGLDQLVATSDTGYLSVKYGDLQWVMLQAIKELWHYVTDKFNNHDERITHLENELADVKAQLAAVQTTAGSTTPQNSPNTTFVPEITIMGNNPAYVEIGASYNDLGATAQNPDGNDLTIKTYVDDAEVASVQLDTSTDRTYTIRYEATWDGQTATAERTVIVGTGQSTTTDNNTDQTPLEPTQDSTQTNTPTDNAPAADTTTTDSTPDESTTN